MEVNEEKPAWIRSTTIALKDDVYQELRNMRFTLEGKEKRQVSFNEVVKILMQSYNGSATNE